MGISSSGTLCSAKVFPVFTSTKAALTKELPMSYPMAIIRGKRGQWWILFLYIFPERPNEIPSFAWSLPLVRQNQIVCGLWKNKRFFPYRSVFSKLLAWCFLLLYFLVF